MKSLPASLLLATTAIVQALALFRYTNDAMAFSGQVFFPVLFALMAVYISWRTVEGSRYPLGHIVILAFAVVLLAATVVGMTASLYYFYPSVYVYYLALGLLVLELALRIAALPKKEKKQGSTRRQKRRRGSHLVAVKKDGAGSGSASAGE
ncbi:MAG: hypothetical protein Q3965_00230 [Rothia sp. (in: high G+C Gram-positive bacteria)]|nr:hypothetical protein [Rothia sp. (in: high G+C Gram-positive bacteria)]